MSARYVKSNSEGAMLLFKKRFDYSQISSVAQTPGAAGPAYLPTALVDFIAEKFLYGRVDRYFVPIAMTRSRQRNHLRAISAAQTQEKNLRAIHFVVDAFNAMAQQFSKCALEGKIATDDPFLSRLKAYRAFEDPILKYQQYMARYIALFKSNANSDPSNLLENYKQFEEVITEAVSLTGISAPITYTGFVKSRRCPINASGLVIEIANLNASDDEEKVAQLLESKNWDFFVSTAATYGFMIDKAVPWRLVADIGSATMVKYASAYGMNDTDTILARCYQSTGPIAAATFATQLYNMYNKSTPSAIMYSEECNGKLVMKQKLPEKYPSPARLASLYKSDHFLSLYCKIRFKEEESSYSDNERRLLIDDTIELVTARSRTIAIRQFERFLNKPFDYAGSLSYYKNWQKLADAEKEAASAGQQTYEAYGKIPREG